MYLLTILAWVGFSFVYFGGASVTAGIMATIAHLLAAVFTADLCGRILNRIRPDAMIGDYSGILGFQLRVFVLLPVFIATLVGVLCAAGVIGLIDGVG